MSICRKKKIIPSRELTYPTLGKGKSSSKCHFFGGYVSSLEGIHQPCYPEFLFRLWATGDIFIALLAGPQVDQLTTNPRKAQFQHFGATKRSYVPLRIHESPWKMDQIIECFIDIHVTFLQTYVTWPLFHVKTKVILGGSNLPKSRNYIGSYSRFLFVIALPEPTYHLENWDWKMIVSFWERCSPADVVLISGKSNCKCFAIMTCPIHKCRTV